MKRIKEKVAICYYKSSKTVIKNNHITTVTTECELIFCESKAKSKYYSQKNKKKPLFKV